MITLLIPSHNAVEKTLVSSLKKFSGRQGVCVLLSRPAKVVKAALKKEKVNFSKFIFVDTVLKSDDSDVVHVDKSSLTGLSITIREALNEMSGKRFVVFEAFSTLSIANSGDSLSRFALYVYGMARELDIDLVVLAGDENGNQSIIRVLKQGADKVVGKVKVPKSAALLETSMALQQAL